MRFLLTNKAVMANTATRITINAASPEIRPTAVPVSSGGRYFAVPPKKTENETHGNSSYCAKKKKLLLSPKGVHTHHVHITVVTICVYQYKGVGFNFGFGIGFRV
jgi:hypothetical protein